MNQATDQGVLRPFFETLLTFSPSLFYLQAVQIFTAILNGFFGLFGIPPLFQAF